MKMGIIRKLMDSKNKEWWKGSFPTWIVAALIAVCGFFLQREIETNDTHREHTSQAIVDLKVRMAGLETRMGVLENTALENHKILTEISGKIQF